MKGARQHRLSSVLLEQGCCSSDTSMHEQPPKPDVPQPPDVIKRPQPVNKPIPPGEPVPEDRPDVHPVPPPTDPGPGGDLSLDRRGDREQPIGVACAADKLHADRQTRRRVVPAGNEIAGCPVRLNSCVSRSIAARTGSGRPSMSTDCGAERRRGDRQRRKQQRIARRRARGQLPA